VNLKEQIYLYVNSTNKGEKNLIEDFFYLPLMSMTPVVQLEVQKSLGIFEKILEILLATMYSE